MNDAQIDELGRRVSTSLQDEFHNLCRFYVKRLSTQCESPIEMMLGAAILSAWNLDLVIRAPMELGNKEDRPTPFCAYLIPQYSTESGHRIDLVVYWHYAGQIKLKLGIECDGHDFHEKTKEQAARDKRRDRQIMGGEGIPVFRFTGSEIFRDPAGCALEIISAVWDEEMRRVNEADQDFGRRARGDEG